MRFLIRPLLLILLVVCFPSVSFSQSSGKSSKGGGGSSGMAGGSLGGMSGRGMPGGQSDRSGYPGGTSGGYPSGNMGSGGYPGGSMGGGYGESAGGSIARPSLAFTVDDKPFKATRVHSFQYFFHSFRPQLVLINQESKMGIQESKMGGTGYGGGATMGIKGAGMGSEGNGSAGYGSSNGYAGSGISGGQQLPWINIYAYTFDGEKVIDRTRIELMIEQPDEGMDGGPGLGESGSGGDMYGGGMGMGGMSSEPRRMQTFLSLAKPKTQKGAKLSESEIKLVSDIICQSIWKEDAIKALYQSKGQGESATENENLLKQLLAEQYDTQLARQEMEAESIKQRLDQLVDELKRRKLAKDRVVEVQLGRLILDAQGLLNNDK